MLVLLVLVSLVGCGSKQPVLYPNERLEMAGPGVAEQNVAECQKLAEDYVPPEGEAELAKGTAKGGAIGAAGGAAGGAIRGSPGIGAAIGAAVGGTVALMRGLFRKSEPDPIEQRFVERCLAKRGYEVVGWR